jgi:hypothetical protein
MDRQATRHLHTLLSALDPSVAEPALQPLERLVTRSGLGDALITAVVGASGVGKSEIINALAGARVVTAGPLRPTTTEIAVWGDLDTAYLPGARISDPDPIQGVILIDTPAAEHYPETVANVLDVVDAVMFVTSHERYADAITATLMDAIRERGIPMFVVLSVGLRDPSNVDELVEDAESKLGAPVVATGDAGPLKLLLEEMVRDRGDLIDRRGRAAAALTAKRTGEVAGVLEERVIASRIVVEKADRAFARARVDRRQLAATADEEWDVAAPAMASLAADAIGRAIRELAADVGTNDVFSIAFSDLARSLPSVDQGPIDEWHRTTTDIALASIKRRRLHPLRSRAVREEFWRLSVDFDRRPSKRVRKALRDRLPDTRFNQGVALTIALGDAGSARIGAFRTGLDPSSRVSPEDLRTAAVAVAASGSIPGEAADDVA